MLILRLWRVLKYFLAFLIVPQNIDKGNEVNYFLGHIFPGGLKMCFRAGREEINGKTIK